MKSWWLISFAFLLTISVLVGCACRGGNGAAASSYKQPMGSGTVGSGFSNGAGPVYQSPPTYSPGGSGSSYDPPTYSQPVGPDSVPQGSGTH